MAQRYLGLDIGTQAIKAAVITGSLRSWSVIERIEEPIEPGDELQWTERARSALAKLTGRLRAETTAAALPATAAIVTRLRRSLTDPRKVAAAVGFELEAHMIHELDAVVYDYRLDAKDEQGSDISIAYAPRADVGAWLDLLATAQVDPRHLVPAAAALKFTARMMDPQKTGAGPFLVVDVGARFTSMCVVDALDIPYCRSVRYGSQDIEAAAAAGGGDPGAAAASAAMVLAEHVRITLLGYTAATRREVQAVFLCGGGSLVPGMAEFLGRTLQVRCEPAAGALLTHLDPGDGGRFSLAVALALQAGTGMKREVVSLRRDAFTYKGEYKFLRGKLIQMGVAVAIVILLALANTVVKFRTLASHEDKLDVRLQEVTKNLLGKPYDDYKIALSIVKQKISPQASPIPKITALDYFNQVSVRFPVELRIELREFSVQGGKIRLEGDTESFEAVDKIVNGLKANKCFDEINKGRVKKSMDGTKVEFDLTVTPKC